MEVTGRRLDMEEELVLFCEPCEVENSKSSADGACRECKEYMCNSCFKHHLKSKHSRKHVLLSLDKFSLLTLDSGSEDVTKCEKHDNENIKFYCRLHEIVGCGDCIVLGHTTCKPEYIKELSKTFIDGDIYKAIVKRFEDIGKLKSDYEKEIEENKGGIEKMTETALNEIRHFRTEINNCLDKAEANILSKVQTLSKEYAVLLEEIENDLKLVSSELEEVQRMINTKLHSENAFFIKVVDSKCKLSDLIECMFKIMAKNKRLKRFEFVKNDQISKLLKTSELLGILQTETGFSQQPKTSTTAGTVVKYNPPQAKDIMLWNGVTENINTVHKCITAMKEYEGKSLEVIQRKYLFIIYMLMSYMIFK